MSQVKQVTFETVAGGQQTLRLQDYEPSATIESWQEPDKALSGKLRQNVRGSRRRYRFSYTHSTEANEFRLLINNIATDLQNGEDSIILSEGSSLDDIRVVVPTESFRQSIEYTQQVATFKPVLEFIDTGLNRLAGTYVEEGYVTQGYVE